MSEHRPTAEPWPDPAAPSAVSGDADMPRVRKPVRNYLAAGEKRRMFWLFMPPALVAMLLLGWVERTWFGRVPAPVPPQVDTKLLEVPADPSLSDAVTIAAEPEPPTGDADEFGAPVYALAKVRDDTVFLGPEHEAWFQLWTTLRETDMQALIAAPARRVGFTELFGQPRAYRGRLVRFRGTLHRLEKLAAPPNHYEIQDYWQGWLEPEGGPVAPIVVYFLRLPVGMPHGMKIAEPVEVVGYFFKRWAYAATDTVRLAPAVLALEPIWKPRPAGTATGNPLGSFALWTMAALVLLTVLGIRAAGRGPGRRAPPPPADLSASLADVEPFSVDDALRRMEESARESDHPSAREPSR
ncbi:MAG: hypothetical protein ACKOK8_02120 [Planctomycetia bacterium]